MPKKVTTPKENKLFDNLQKVIRQLMTGRGFIPLSLSDIMDKLHLPVQHRETLLKVLESLIHSGEIVLKKNLYSLKKSKADVVSGLIRMHPRGFGFVELDDKATYTQDIFIPKHLTQNAVDGDKVEIIVNKDIISEKGPEGKVIGILERGRTHIAGIIRGIDKHGELIAYVPMLGPTQRVVVDAGKRKKLVVGDRLVMEVTNWGDKESETSARFSQYLGHISDYKCDVVAAIEEYNLRNVFPVEAVEEAQDFGKSVRQKDIKEREDLRELECFTIDPDTAKDFDDALSLTVDSHGNYHLGVHIADVTHYVAPGSALDVEARQRANSTYFPGECLPMLPPELSNNLCSLKPNVNRLSVSVLMILNNHGDLLSYRIVRSVIRSKKRFTYKEAKVILDKKKENPYYDTLKLMEELCHLLKKKRFERGSLDLALPDLIVIVDGEGLPLRTEYIKYDITHQLVEEFMLKANEVIATHLNEKGLQLTYRVHDSPPTESVKDFVSLARAFGFEIPDNPTQEELQKLFDDSLETPYGQHLATSYIRRMRMAIYSPTNIGHYGLSLTHYCHFTSPIRRYADLVVHRILLGGKDDLLELETISNHCSEQERFSAKAESSVKLLKKLRLLQETYKENSLEEYEAVVTNVKPWGITVEILTFMMDAFIHISEIGDDYFIFEERKMQIVGKYQGTTYRVGDKIKVHLRSIDFILLESKWDIVQPEVTIKKVVKKSKIKQKQSEKPRSKTKSAISTKRKRKKTKKS